jgi:hypothetical protein
MKIDLGGGRYIEPEEGPRNTRWHKRILRVSPAPGARGGKILDLECGHQALAFGNLALCGGVALCQQCRNEAN